MSVSKLLRNITLMLNYLLYLDLLNVYRRFLYLRTASGAPEARGQRGQRGQHSALVDLFKAILCSVS